MKKLLSLVLLTAFVFTSCGPDEKKFDYDVIVVGAGGGGLAAAARLSLKEKKVLLIEQHYKVGGYMGSFVRGDYTFEISLHAMDGLDPDDGMNVQVFKDLGIYEDVKPIKMDPMYKVVYPSLTITVPADYLEYKKLLIENFPHEKEGIEKFYAAQDRIFGAMSSGMKITQDDVLGGIWDMITNPGNMWTMMSYTNSTMADYLNDFFKDKLLLSVMSALTGMLGDGPDNISGLIFSAMWNSYHRGGYYYFEDGSQSIATALEEVIKENGGQILVSNLVTKILVEDGAAVGVIAEDKMNKEIKKFTGRYVVSNANAPDTFFKLVGEEKLDEDFVNDIKEMEPGAATFNLYLGVKKDYNNLFAGTSHQIIVNKFDDFREIFKPMKEGDIEGVQFGIANYSNLEQKIAPKGKNVLSIVTLMPHDWNNGWFEDEGEKKYQRLKKIVGNKLINRIEDHLPGLRKNIEVIEIASPKTNVHYTLNYKGSIYGWANSVRQSLMNRLPQETPIENLYLAGAWTFPAGGQSAVLMSGYLAAEMIIDDMD